MVIRGQQSKGEPGPLPGHIDPKPAVRFAAWALRLLLDNGPASILPKKKQAKTLEKLKNCPKCAERDDEIRQLRQRVGVLEQQAGRPAGD